MNAVSRSTLVILLLMVLGGCSAFRSSKTVDVTPFAEHTISLVKVQTDQLEARVLQAIEDDYAGVIEMDDVVRKAQVRTLRSVMLLSEHRGSGDPEAIVRLREHDPSLRPYLPEGNRLTPEEMERAEQRLTWRLTEYREVQQLLAQDIAAHDSMIRELDELAGGTNAMLMKTRATVWIWARAHARLAAGVTDPAKFDIMGVAKQAMDAALPF